MHLPLHTMQPQHWPLPYSRSLLCRRPSLVSRRADNRSLSADDSRSRRARDSVGRRVRITEPMDRMRSTSEPSTSVELSRACSGAVQQARLLSLEKLGKLDWVW